MNKKEFVLLVEFVELSIKYDSKLKGNIFK